MSTSAGLQEHSVSSHSIQLPFQASLDQDSAWNCW